MVDNVVLYPRADNVIVKRMGPARLISSQSLMFEHCQHRVRPIKPTGSVWTVTNTQANSGSPQLPTTPASFSPFSVRLWPTLKQLLMRHYQIIGGIRVSSTNEFSWVIHDLNWRALSAHPRLPSVVVSVGFMPFYNWCLDSKLESHHVEPSIVKLTV